MGKTHYSRELSKVLYFEVYGTPNRTYNKYGTFYVLQAFDVSSLKIRELLVDADLYEMLKKSRKRKYLLVGLRGGRRVRLDKKKLNRVQICDIFEKVGNTTWYDRLKMRFLTLRLNWSTQPSNLVLPSGSQEYYIFLFYNRGVKLFRFSDSHEITDVLKLCNKATYVLDGNRVIIIAFSPRKAKEIHKYWRLRRLGLLRKRFRITEFDSSFFI